MNYEIVGVENVCFTPKDSVETISGVAVYLAKEIAAEKGTGLHVERHFLSTAKMARLGIDPDTLIGKKAKPLYNRYGKLEYLDIVD